MVVSWKQKVERRTCLKFDVPNKIVLDADDFRETVWDDLGFDEKSRRKQNDRLLQGLKEYYGYKERM